MALSKIRSDSLEDTAVHGQRNLIINGAMQVAQRGTSFTGITSTIAYRMDRWQVGFGAAGSNYSITQSTDVPDNFKYSMKWQRTASNAVTNSIWFSQAFESVNSKVVAGKTCTLSYYAKKGANYSASSSDIQVRIISGTGTDQSATSAITAGWTGYATPLSTTQVITTGWVRYTHTVTFASNVNQVSVNLASNSAGTAGADDSLFITGIQLELGETATPFEHRSFGDELLACQRYYEHTYPYGTAPGTANGGIGADHRYVGRETASNYGYYTAHYRVEKRAAATVTVYSYVGTANQIANGDTGGDSGAVGVIQNGTTSFLPRNTSGSGVSARALMYHFKADAEL